MDAAGVLDRREYRRQILIAYAAVQAVRCIRTDLMLAAIARAHAAGPVVDPTLYRGNAQAMREDEAMLRILDRARCELDALPWPTVTPERVEFLTPPAAEHVDRSDVLGPSTADADGVR